MRQTICRNRNTSNIQIPDSPCLTYKKNRVIQKENILASQFSTVGYVDWINMRNFVKFALNIYS